ncbi:FUSC family protein [Isoptericola sp. AK164]|uniref:FUSC family protein n=1 Tax=Isoptericola sp. AK164 TaxID=3024246 RepID=UPI0024186760|nr:FUSC family protein [Isoptericola sp. AK164]
MRLASSPVVTTARDVLDTQHLRAALRVSPADATLAAALRCGAAVGLALAVCAATGHRDLAGFAALGALASLFGRFDPYRRRAAVLALLGGLLTTALVATSALTAAGAAPAVTLLAVAAIAGATTVLCRLVRTGPPGATIVVFAAAGGLAGPLGWPDVAERGGAALVGAAIAWTVGMSGYLARPSAPARLAVRRAADAVRRAAGPSVDTAGDLRHGDAVRTARAAIDTARAALADDSSHRRTRGTARSLTTELDAVERVLDDTAGGPAPDRPRPARTSLREQAVREARSSSWRLTGVRVVLASLGAGLLATAGGLTHPAWAQMGATATLQGTTAQHAVVRALQRAAGTAVGALVAWLLLDADLGFAATCVLVVALQVVTELVVGRHYGLAMLTITPMALLMTSLAAPADAGGIALARALDTVLGAAVGVGAVVLVHPRRRRRGPAGDGPDPDGSVGLRSPGPRASR